MCQETGGDNSKVLSFSCEFWVLEGRLAVITTRTIFTLHYMSKCKPSDWLWTPHGKIFVPNKRGHVGKGVVGSRPMSYVVAVIMWLCRT